MDKAEINAKIFCRHCGTENNQKDVTCCSCGRIFESGILSFCPFCGLKIKDMLSPTCKYCGANHKNVISLSVKKKTPFWIMKSDKAFFIIIFLVFWVFLTYNAVQVKHMKESSEIFAAIIVFGIASFILSALLYSLFYNGDRIVQIRKELWVCTKCGYKGVGKPPFNVWLFIILLIFYVIPGLIYVLFLQGVKRSTCPKCGNKKMTQSNNYVATSNEDKDKAIDKPNVALRNDSIDPTQRIMKLKELLDKRLITESDFEKKKTDIISEL